MQYIHKNESKHSEMGPVRQTSIQRTVRSVHMCVHRTVHNCCRLNRDEVMQIWRLGGCEDSVSESEEFVFDAFGYFYFQRVKTA